MSIRLLKTLVAISEHKTFGAAADAIFITHAAVSQQMKTLEESLQIKIFDRTARTPELTPLGLQLVEKAKKLIADYENLVPSLMGDDIFSGDLLLGVVPTSLVGLAPKTISFLRQSYPNLRIKIFPNLTNTLMVELSRNTLDAAILSQTNLPPKDIVFEPFANELLELITSTKNTQTDAAEILKTNPYIRFNREAVVGTMIESWLQSKNISVNEVMELHSLEAISSMVSAELGVSIVPKLCVTGPYDIPLRSISLDDPNLSRTIGLAYKPSNPKLRAIHEVYNALSFATNNIETNTP
jgi:DNA-binding transcriptional LysR family regulator